VRELENIIERSISFANTSEILPADLPPNLRQTKAPEKHQASAQRLMLMTATGKIIYFHQFYSVSFQRLAQAKKEAESAFLSKFCYNLLYIANPGPHLWIASRYLSEQAPYRYTLRKLQIHSSHDLCKASKSREVKFAGCIRFR
jgi:transcriptional regulator with AAA-type ATPase domain